MCSAVVLATHTARLVSTYPAYVPYAKYLPELIKYINCDQQSLHGAIILSSAYFTL